jgi:hypothetical protein
MRDFRVLLWLRWRQFRDGLVYWMRVLGYDPKSTGFFERLYPLYLLVIGGFWVFAMWGWGHDNAVNIGSNIHPTTLADLLNAIPPAVLILQVFVIVVALRSTPLKLSFADMSYVAGSPIARSVPVLLGFLRQVIFRLVLIAGFFSLFALVLTRPLTQGIDLSASLRAVLAVIPLVVLTWALGWLLGILRLVYPTFARVPFLWLLPLLLLLIAHYFPAPFMWPGQALVLLIYGIAPWWVYPFLTLLAVGLVAAFVWLGNRINMIRAVDESILHARVAALGLLAFRQPDLLLRIRLQSASAGRKPFLSLPKVYGFQTLVTRAALSYLRHPFMLLFSLLWGAAMAQAAVWIIANQLPVQLWIGWLLVVGIAPPVGLLHVFRIDVEERFLRQFLLVDGLQLLMADMLLPLIATIAGAMGIWMIQGFDPEITSIGALFIPILAILVALCGAVALTNKRVLQTRILATGITFGLIMIVGVNFSPIFAFVVALLSIMTLGGMVSQNA